MGVHFISALFLLQHPSCKSTRLQPTSGGWGSALHGSSPRGALAARRLASPLELCWCPLLLWPGGLLDFFKLGHTPPVVPLC